MANTNQGGKSQGDMNREKSQSEVDRSSSEKDNLKRNPSMSDDERVKISREDDKTGETRRDKTGSTGSTGSEGQGRNDQRNR